MPVRRACLSLLALAAALSFFAGVSQAQTYYGDFKVIGTDADAGISFEFLASVPLLTPGLQQTFSLISCTVPAGEDCSPGQGQVGYGAAGGQIRLTTAGVNGKSRTWFFPSLLHTGVYIGQTGAGVEPGYVILSGADATAGQPQSNATGSAFQFPLEVTVNDSAPNYQSGVTVTFTAPGSGPTASFPSGGQATTDATGRARITPTADGTPGAYQITATAAVGGNTFQTSFVAANVNTANAAGPCLVTTANDDFSVGSLRYQVAACGKGGTITFAPGITPVNVTVVQDIPLTQDLTIDGGSGVTINVNGPSRIFFMAGGTITLKNLTLQNGSALGGAGGGGNAGGGGAAGMGGAIFVNAGSLVIDNVTFTGNLAAGGAGGSVLNAFRLGGGGGMGGPGGSAASTGAIAGNGGGGGDFGSIGGAGTSGNPPNGSGDGAGGGNGGDGAFAGGSSAGGIAGFGGGGGAEASTGGTFGGSGTVGTFGGAGGAGLGGAIFMRNGTLSLTNATFSSNGAIEGASQSGASNGQGKGGALYISSTASAVSTTAFPTFNNNAASSAGAGTACNTVVGATAVDTNDICGILTGPATHFSVSAPASVTSYINYSMTVTALDASNNVVTGYSGTVHLTSTEPGFTNSTGDSTLTNGVGTFTVMMKQAGTQTITATDTVDSSITGTSNGILVNPGAPNYVIVSAPATTNSGETFAFTVKVTDLYGNPVTSYGGTLHFTSSDAAAVLPADSLLAGGTGSFNATLTTTGTQTITATDTVTNTLTGTSNGVAVSIPSLVVTTIADSGAGSLRAALTTAAANGSGNITFDPTIFATPQTITVVSTLNVPSNATISGATSGSGASLTNLVTVSGGGSSSNFPVFTVNSGVTGAAIANLIIANGHIDSQGGGILNGGSLTVTNSTLANNYAGGYATGGGNGGGAIFTDGTLTVVGSTFIGNTSAPGGAIGANSGQVTITNSTFYGNSAVANKVGGAIFINNAAVSVNGSTFSGNSAVGGGAIFNYGTLTATNSILSGNSGGDCGAGGSSTCPSNGSNGNVIGASGVDLAPLGNYGGPTQTMLPGGVAICAGSSSLIPAGVTTDQRGFLRTNTTYIGYSSSNPCVDAGAVQTNYQSVQFSSSSYSGRVNDVINPAPVVSVLENGRNIGGVPITLDFSGTGTASGLGPVTTVAGVGATFGALSVNQAGSDTLSVTLPITTGNTLSASASLDIAAAPTTTTASNATAIANASAQAVTLNATVTSSAGTVNKGTVTFTLLQGSTVIGVAASGGVSNGNAAVNYTLPGGTATGTYTVAAAYADSSNTFAASSDNTHTLTVAHGSYALTVTANNATRAYGAPNPAFTGTVTGAVGGDSFTESFSTTATQSSPVGAYPIVPSVTGANLSNYTVDAHNGTLTITQAASITTLTGSNASITTGQNLTLTAQVRSATTGTPTGSVNFYDGPSLLNTATLANGTATYATTALGSGSHTLTAVYSGDTNFNTSTSTPFSVTPLPVLDFTLTGTSATYQTVIPGASASFTYNLSPTQGTYPGPVSFTVSGLPQGATYTISPSTVAANAGPQTVTLLVTTAPATTQSRVEPGSKGHLAWALLLLPLAGARRLRRSGRRMRLMAIAVFLLVGGAGLAVITGCGSDNGFLGQAPQNYSVTVTATAGTVQHASTVTLNVQ